MYTFLSITSKPREKNIFLNAGNAIIECCKIKSDTKLELTNNAQKILLQKPSPKTYKLKFSVKKI